MGSACWAERVALKAATFWGVLSRPNWAATVASSGPPVVVPGWVGAVGVGAVGVPAAPKILEKAFLTKFTRPDSRLPIIESTPLPPAAAYCTWPGWAW
ncbi:hypothetical protein D3C72_1270550 [compost metagenome]